MACSSIDCAADELGRLAESGSTSPRRRRAGWLIASIALVASLPVLSQSVAAGSPVATKAGKAGKVTLFPGMDRPLGIVTGPDGALWFTNQDSNAIGRITTTGAAKFFFGASIQIPTEIVAGPDGALWFTNQGNGSIGRITTVGAITSYTDSSMSDPVGIAAGPDGALWFTNYNNNSIGRITTAGVVTHYTDPTIASPSGIAEGADGALWYTQLLDGLDRADYHRGGDHQLQRPEHQLPTEDCRGTGRIPVVHQ